MTTTVEKPPDPIRCPRCGRQKFYHVKKTDSYRCQACGQVWPALTDAPQERHD